MPPRDAITEYQIVQARVIELGLALGLVEARDSRGISRGYYRFPGTPHDLYMPGSGDLNGYYQTLIPLFDKFTVDVNRDELVHNVYAKATFGGIVVESKGLSPLDAINRVFDAFLEEFGKRTKKEDAST